MNDNTIYGFCHIAWLPLRAEASHRSEMVSQLLFGESFRILDRTAEWCLVETDFDHYKGYVAAGSFSPLALETWEALQQNRLTTCTFLQITDVRRKLTFPVPPSSTLPLMEGRQMHIGEEHFETTEIPMHVSMKGSIQPYLHAPYLWGGRTPWGIDCSGFVQALYKMQGITLPRDASQQMLHGEKVPPSQAQFGDLAFFHNSEGKICHVGMIADARTIVHASGRVREDDWDEKGIFCRETRNYSHLLHSIRHYCSFK
ncbi:MAG: C40 family peptidase [Bacteroidales bacterium]|nr:C40 family peptidase [Bacteroidales bacterium]